MAQVINITDIGGERTLEAWNWFEDCGHTFCRAFADYQTYGPQSETVEERAYLLECLRIAFDNLTHAGKVYDTELENQFRRLEANGNETSA